MSEGKSFPEMPAGKLMPNPIPNVLLMDISVDFIMGLPKVQGYDAVGIYSPLLASRSCDLSRDHDSCYLADAPTLNSGPCTLQLCI